jgi:CHASE2 domain
MPQAQADKPPPHWLAGFWVPLLVAFGLLAALQFPVVKQSFVGTPDRAMVDLAFKMRRGQVGGTADPVLWLDMDQSSLEDHFRAQRGRDILSQVPPTERGTPNAAPRDMIANLLTYSRSGGTVRFTRGASLVVLDTFLAWDSGNEDAEQALMEALEAWSHDENAPILGLVQADIAPSDGSRAYNQVLPSRFDEIVARAPNMVWVHPGVMKDDASIAREYHPFQCVLRQQGEGTPSVASVPSVATLAAYVQMADRAHPTLSQAQRNQHTRNELTLAQNRFVRSCDGRSMSSLRGVPIKYHLGYSLAKDAPAAAPVDQGWQHRASCGTPRALTRLPARGFNDPGQPRDITPLCGHMVIIGANNDLLPDLARTPVGQPLPGPVVLANLMRSAPLDLDETQQLKDWQRIGLQALLLLVLVCVQVPVAKWLETRHFSYAKKMASSKRLAAIPGLAKWVLTHPLVLKFLLPIVVSFVGLTFTLWGLDIGFHAIVSAPVYAVALVNAWQQFNTLASHAMDE